MSDQRVSEMLHESYNKGLMRSEPVVPYMHMTRIVL